MYSFVGRRSTRAETTAAAATHLGVTTSHAYSAEVPVLHTPVEVRFGMTCRFVHGQGKRGNVSVPAIMSVAFPEAVSTCSRAPVAAARTVVATGAWAKSKHMYLIRGSVGA